MSKPINKTEHYENMHLTECTDGFWLWDDVVEMNLAMRARSKEEAFVEALNFYQKYYPKVKRDQSKLQKTLEEVAGKIRVHFDIDDWEGF